jgi:putative tryptophan/tyrosine transport system substrate-binding protein
MKRRALLGVSALVAAVGPIAAVAQQQATEARLGWLGRGDTEAWRGFAAILGRLGWVEGKNLTIDRRFADSNKHAAAELVALHPDALIGVGGPDVQALLSETRTIPIVFITVSDPVALGFVKSLPRPGGNVTGVSSMTPELELKQLELIRDLLPQAKRVSMLRDPRNPGTETRFAADQQAAPSLGLTLVRRWAGSADEIEAAFAAASADRDDAVHIEFSGFTLLQRVRTAELASRYRLPMLCGLRAYAEAGGLLSYGPIYSDNFERAAVLVDKILRGAMPADLPVEQPTKFELVVNLKTAKALSLTVPRSMLDLADEVIE